MGEIITTLIDINHIKISSMTLRIKSEEALKISHFKAKYNHLDELPIFSAAVLSPFLKAMSDKIFDLIDKTFEIVEIDQQAEKSIK